MYLLNLQSTEAEMWKPVLFFFFKLHAAVL